jgi:hypothetical protein
MTQNETIQAGAFLVKEAARLIRDLHERAKHAKVELDPKTATFLVQPSSWLAIAAYVEHLRGTEEHLHYELKHCPGISRMLFGVPVTIIGSDPDVSSIRLVMEPVIKKPT